LFFDPDQKKIFAIILLLFCLHNDKSFYDNKFKILGLHDHTNLILQGSEVGKFNSSQIMIGIVKRQWHTFFFTKFRKFLDADAFPTCDFSKTNLQTLFQKSPSL
jgi:hypothetical protein